MAAFTTIAAASALAITAGTTAVSFGQASSQRKLMDKANKKADEMMADARAKLDVNVFEDLDVNKELYLQEQNRVNEQAQLALQQAQEGDTRGAAATAGRVQLATGEGQNRVRASQEAEVNKIETMVAKEEGRLRDLDVQLDLQEVAGAQQAAKDAEVARNKAKAEAIQGVAATATQALPFIGMAMSGSAGTQKGVLEGMDLADIAGNEAFKDYKFNKTALGDIDFSKMTNKDFRNFRSGLNDAQSGLVFGSQAYTTGLEQALAPKTGLGKSLEQFGTNFANPFSMAGSGMAGMSQEEIQKFLMLKQMGLL